MALAHTHRNGVILSAAILLTVLASCASYEGSNGVGDSDAGGDGVGGNGAGSAGVVTGGSSNALGGSDGQAATAGLGTAGSLNSSGGSAGDTTTGGSSGGDPSASGASSGGRASGGNTAKGGSAFGGSSGGSAGGSVGAGAGGTSAGGTSAGGVSAGGASMGGTSAGGASSGGTSAGGSGGGAAVDRLLSQKQPSTADSEQTTKGNLAGLGNDGVTTTRWCAADGAANHYWQVDLGANYTLSKLQITWEKAAVYKFKVEGSPDGNTWAQFLDETNTTNASASQTYQLSTLPIARWVRVTVTGLPTSTTWASFYEFAVTGH